MASKQPKPTHTHTLALTLETHIWRAYSDGLFMAKSVRLKRTTNFMQHCEAESNVIGRNTLIATHLNIQLNQRHLLEQKRDRTSERERATAQGHSLNHVQLVQLSRSPEPGPHVFMNILFDYSDECLHCESSQIYFIHKYESTISMSAKCAWKWKWKFVSFHISDFVALIFEWPSGLRNLHAVAIKVEFSLTHSTNPRDEKPKTECQTSERDTQKASYRKKNP